METTLFNWTDNSFLVSDISPLACWIPKNDSKAPHSNLNTWGGILLGFVGPIVEGDSPIFPGLTYWRILSWVTFAPKTWLTRWAHFFALKPPGFFFSSAYRVVACLKAFFSLSLIFFLLTQACCAWIDVLQICLIPSFLSFSLDLSLFLLLVPFSFVGLVGIVCCLLLPGRRNQKFSLLPDILMPALQSTVWRLSHTLDHFWWIVQALWICSLEYVIVLQQFLQSNDGSILTLQHPLRLGSGSSHASASFDNEYLNKHWCYRDNLHIIRKH